MHWAHSIFLFNPFLHDPSLNKVLAFCTYRGGFNEITGYTLRLPVTELDTFESLRTVFID
ncbi:hypothetical protein [Photorhabdus luminescens]|uniref:Uncharacterized protein n=1 Tax=Photorhabdus luminescens subsp. sonorensis TaxID=1173677 RepID=A0A5C4RID5_PHOLU|nr:hypothetical protein [Photorhabdus luminescens]TNH43529.1 hypothetical protein EP164_11180 [Photorhabdus luminescens subsp. sonorensis]